MVIAQSVVDEIVDGLTDTVQDTLLRDGNHVWLHGNDDDRIALEQRTMTEMAHAILITVHERYVTD